ncbi:MAG TPA: DNA polymerase III subunit gamma/tau [Candidatus Babeliales bacterium]|nr:DNA polymerase III subunit gamma/tau [Candidatus Babeliales bacterium]
MSTTYLNLARKWRSKNFSQIIGQQLSVRMIKNSLYLNHFFPVYLFAGQRGCGKTTTARVFAAAINCANLDAFQKNPRETSLPCLSCESCKAMEQGSHPDFIEMDAASHTGVDNVRQIIEAASLLPLLGKKKVYLIDEAHMLSKAAFNAFLKILEEPPASVLFILATTDDQKIIETVRSRCFQLFFRAIGQTDLHGLLVDVCQKEEIGYDESGLQLLIRETGGSARDALNLLEQVRFSSDKITEKNVLRVLGSISDDQVCALLHSVFNKAKSPQELVECVSAMKLELFTPEIVWHRFMAALKTAVWHKYGVPSTTLALTDDLKSSIEAMPLSLIVRLFDFACQQEQLFLKTVDKHLFLSMFWIRIWAIAQNQVTESVAPVAPAPVVKSASNKQPAAISQPPVVAPESQKVAVKNPNLWERFLEQVTQLDDKLIVSLFAHAKLKNYDQDSSKLEVSFQKRFELFQDLFAKKDGPWFLLLQEVFGSGIQLEPVFEQEAVASTSGESKPVAKKVVEQPKKQFYQSNNTVNVSKKDIPLDISDKTAWAMTHALLERFPGTVTEFKEETDE